MGDINAEKVAEFLADASPLCKEGEGVDIKPSHLKRLAAFLIKRGWHKDHWVPLQSAPTVSPEARVH